MDGIAHLRRAKDELISPEGGRGSRRVRLPAAAREFWYAAFDYESWPPRLQRRAADVLRGLFRGGAIDETVRNASDGTVEALSGEILAFCDEAVALDLTDGPESRDPTG